MHRSASWFYFQYVLLALVLQRVCCGLLDSLPPLGVSIPGWEANTPTPEEECLRTIERNFPEFLDDDYVTSVMRSIRGNGTLFPGSNSRSKRSVDVAASIEPLIDQLKDLYKKGWHKRKQHRKNLKKNEEKIQHFLMPYGRGLNYEFYNITERIYETVYKMVFLRKDIRDSFRERLVVGRSRHYGLKYQDVPRKDFYDYYVRAADSFNAAARTFDKVAALRRRALRNLHKVRNFRNMWRRKNFILRLHDLDRKSIKALTISWRARLLGYYVKRDYKRIQKLWKLLGILKKLKFDLKRHLADAPDTINFLKNLVWHAKTHASDLKEEVENLGEFIEIYRSRDVPSKVHRYIRETSYIPSNITDAHNIISSTKLSLPSNTLTWLCPPLPTEPPVTLPSPQEGSGDVIQAEGPDTGDIYFQENEKNGGSGAVIEENFLFYSENQSTSEFYGILVPVTPVSTYSTTLVRHESHGADDEGSGDIQASGDGIKTEPTKEPDNRPAVCREKLISIETIAHLLYKKRRKLLMDRNIQEEKLYKGNYHHKIGELNMRQNYADRLLEIENRTTPILAEMVMIVANKTDEMVAFQQTTNSGNRAKSILQQLEALPLIHPVPDMKRYRNLLQEVASKIPDVKKDVQQISEDTSKLKKLLHSVDLKSLVNKVLHNTESTAKFQKDVSDGITKLRMNIRKAYSQVASIKKTAVIDKEKTVSLSPWFLTQTNSDVSSVFIDVRTNSTHGTILRLNQNDYKIGRSPYQLTLSIEDSKPSLKWLHRESHRHITTDRAVSDGTWRRITIHRIGTTLKLSERPLMGNSEVMSDIWLPPDASRQPLPPYIHIGQVDYYEDSISGCVMDFTVNSFLLPLAETGRPWTKCSDKKLEFIYVGSLEYDEVFITTQAPGFECLGYTDETKPYSLTLDSDSLKSFSFSFKSETDRSVLMSYYAAANTYLLVYMYGGRLWVNGRTKAGHFRHYCRKPSARPGKWHSVKFHKLDYWVAFYLDNEKCDYVEGDALDSDISSTSRLVLGSVGSDKSSPLSNLKWLKPFRGWIKQFIKNDQMVYFKDNVWAQECPVM